MKRFYLCAFGFILLGCCASLTIAQEDYGESYYLTGGEHVFALDPYPDTDTRRIATYLPITTLVFKDRNPLETTVENVNYKTCFAQYGERFLVPADRISSVSFRRKYGRQSIIFQQPAYICPVRNRDCDDSNGIPINRGDVLELVEKGDDIVTLKVNFDENTKTGVIRLHRFEEWEAQGIIVNSLKSHPSYEILERTELKSLNTECNEEKKFVDLAKFRAEISASASVNAGGFISKISNFFELKFAASTTQELETSQSTQSSYGGEGYSTKFWRVRLKPINPEYFENEQDNDYFLKTEIECKDTNPIYIRNIFVNTMQRKHKASLSHDEIYGNSGCSERDTKGDIKSDNKCYKVYEKNGGRFFFTSINSPAAYDYALKVF